MTQSLYLANARLVLADEVRPGGLVIRDGEIAEIDDSAGVPPGAVDCEGDLLAPGLIELHTDNLERHLTPRPNVNWPHRAAILAHDAELASTGITTVFDALRVGSIEGLEGEGLPRYARALASEILGLRGAGVMKISHFLHLRAEICSETLVEELGEFGAADRVGLVSLMDHTPGQRQFRDLGKYRDYVTGKRGITHEQFDKRVTFLLGLHDRVADANGAAAVAAARGWGAVLASHDDTTEAHVETSAAVGARLAEFPTTGEAAGACRSHGIAVMMGAPNLVRGGSHSGNVAAAELAEEGLLDILSSDYVPASLLHGAMELARLTGDYARGLGSVTHAPADAVGLEDRGRLAVGKRADLIRIAASDDWYLRSVWVRGRQVA